MRALIIILLIARTLLGCHKQTSQHYFIYHYQFARDWFWGSYDWNGCFEVKFSEVDRVAPIWRMERENDGPRLLVPMYEILPTPAAMKAAGKEEER